MNLKKYLSQQVEASLTAAGAEGVPAIIRQSGKPEFGHYQANGVMGAAKKLGMNPRELAQGTLDNLDTEIEENSTLEIAGPGFINITLSVDFIAACLTDMAKDERLGIAEQTKEKVVVDYSSPNLAKEMHIGHLRSTAIGDANVKVLEFLGHEVVRANHVGDWGAQFGSLLAFMDKLEDERKPLATELKDLEVFYQKAS
ncbi:MAG: arginine--tRNA ligase, partial [Pseudomonadales bacterium]|nr:arginine--tRNA ligase [Pseudomonadales bacterium]